MDVDFNLNTINSGLYNYINGIVGKSPMMLISIIVLIVGYSILSPYLGSLSGEDVLIFDKSNDIFEVLLWTIFIFLVLLNGAYVFFGLNINTSINNLFSGKVLEVDLDINEETENKSRNKETLEKVLGDLKLFNEKRMTKKNEDDIEEENDPEKQVIKIEDELMKPAKLNEYNSGKEVFHIPNNKYTYKDAKEICNAYGARLAKYDEVENAYNKGGEWCSYGWSKNQLALFPTQKKTYDELQKKEGHENDCGRPGVNGGYIDNKNVKYGINCFGFKPKMREQEKELMKTQSIYPKTEEDRKFQRNVDKWRNKLPEIMLSPFNSNSWNRV
jgi:hypothetical protein